MWVSLRSITLSAICLLAVGALGQSEVLLQSSADSAYSAAVACVKSRNNDPSACLDTWARYFAEANALLRAFPQAGESERRRKVVGYLEAAAERFFTRAREKRDPADFTRASQCAELLIRVNGKQPRYQTLIDAAETRQAGSVAGAALDSLLNKLQGLPFPSARYLDSFRPFAKNAKKTWETLETPFRSKVVAEGTRAVEQLRSDLRKIAGDLEARRTPNMELLPVERGIYASAVEIPGVERREAEMLELRRRLGAAVVAAASETRTSLEQASATYAARNVRGWADVQRRLRVLEPLARESFEKASGLGDFIPGLPSLSTSDLQERRNRTAFLEAAWQAHEATIAADFKKATRLLDQELAGTRGGPIERQRMTAHRNELLAYATNHSVRRAEILRSRGAFIEAVAAIDDVRDLPFSTSQQAVLSRARHSIANEGRTAALSDARRLAARGQQLDALQRLDAGGALGWTPDLRAYRETLLANFDYSKLRSLAEARYLEDCPGNILQVLTNPALANPRRICVGFAEVIQDLGDGLVRAKVFDREVVVSTGRPDAALEDRTLVFAYRVLGPTKVTRALTGTNVTVPLLESVYMEVPH